MKSDIWIRPDIGRFVRDIGILSPPNDLPTR